MNADIIYPQFTPNDLPPSPSVAFVRWQAQRQLESYDYDWRLAMSRQHPATLPSLVPFWYSRNRTINHAYGFRRKPVDSLASVRARLDTRLRRIGLVEAMDRVDTIERLELAA
jgi:hypothetical protein